MNTKRLLAYCMIAGLATSVAAPSAKADMLSALKRGKAIEAQQAAQKAAEEAAKKAGNAGGDQQGTGQGSGSGSGSGARTQQNAAGDTCTSPPNATDYVGRGADDFTGDNGWRDDQEKFINCMAQKTNSNGRRTAYRDPSTGCTYTPVGPDIPGSNMANTGYSINCPASLCPGECLEVRANSPELSSACSKKCGGQNANYIFQETKQTAAACARNNQVLCHQDRDCCVKDGNLISGNWNWGGQLIDTPQCSSGYACTQGTNKQRTRQFRCIADKSECNQ